MSFSIARRSSVVTSRSAGQACNRTLLMRPIGLCTAQLGLTLVLVTASLAASPFSVGNEPDASLPACQSLMTDYECHTYKVALSGANTPGARDAIKARYDQLQAEREKTCACNEMRRWIVIKPSSFGLNGLF
ncbi:MAG: hypothetical protein ACLPXB_16125 [Thiobacillaceae bacterium]